MFKNILIATDGSKLADKAVNRALALARARAFKGTCDRLSLNRSIQ